MPSLCRAAVFGLVLFCLGSVAASDAEGVDVRDAVAAVVDDKAISHGEVLQLIQPELEKRAQQLGREPDGETRKRVFQAALEELIHHRLLLAEAEKAGRRTRGKAAPTRQGHRGATEA